MCAWKPINQEPRQVPLPIGMSVIKPPPPPIFHDTVKILRDTTAMAETGTVAGLAAVILYDNGAYTLSLSGEAKADRSQMAVVGMLTALQQMALDLHKI